jgi:hypothetical protein
MTVQQDRIQLEEIDLQELGYLSVAQAAQILSCSPGYVRTLIYTEQRLLAKRLGDRVYVVRASLDAIQSTLQRRGRPKKVKE